MARLTREESQAQTRERVLISAREIFAKDGFTKASIESIAEEAGYSKGAVYSNFSTKEELFLELLRAHMRAEIKDLEQLLQSATSPSELILLVGIRYKEIEQNLDWSLLSTEFQIRASRDKAFAKEFAKLYREKRAALTKLLVKLFGQLQKPLPISAENLASGFLALTQGLALQRSTDPKIGSPEQVGRIVQVFLSSVMGVPFPITAAQSTSIGKGPGTDCVAKRSKDKIDPKK